jgi:hypothetical protein
VPDRLYHQATAEMIGEALALVPGRVLERIGGVRFHEGVYGRSWGGVLPDEHLPRYRDWSFFSSPRVHQAGMLRSRREPTIALQPWADRVTVLHELGHALWYALFEQHKRHRVIWDPGLREVVERCSTGLLPSIVWFTGYKPGDYQEQFAEAFALWLLPRELPHRRGGRDRFYVTLDCETVDEWGVRTDNRRLLALFNELAGWPGDLPPRALR